MLNETPPVPPFTVSIPEAARLLGLSPHTIRWYIRHGKIQPTRFGRRLTISMTLIERLSRDGIPKSPDAAIFLTESLSAKRRKE
jgi:excisionase family DNA binding protein